MAFPTILINNSTGSNTAASGAGPSTALTGAGAALTSAAATVNLSANTPNLSGVATDGTAALYVNSSTGRKFGRITAVNDGTDVVTTSETWGVTESGRTWAIGGKRFDFETTNTLTKNLFSADMSAGWSVDIQEAGVNYVLTSTITVSVAGNQTDGRILVRSSSGAYPTITCATNSVVLFTYSSGGGYMEFKHLKLTHTAATRGAAFTRSLGTITNVFYTDLIIDGCLTFWASVTSLGNPILTACEVKNTTSTTAAVGAPGTSSTRMYGCDVHDNAGDGVRFAVSLYALACLFTDNVVGINETGAAGVSSDLSVTGCIIAGNSSDGIKNTTAKTLVTEFFPVALLNNIIYGNGGRDVNFATAQSLVEADLWINRNNASGGNVSARLNFPAGTDDVTLTADPFTDSANRDYSLNDNAGGGAACRGAGYPGQMVSLTTTAFQDIGLQHEDEGAAGDPSMSLTSVIRHIKVLDAAASDGSGKTGLTYSSFTMKYNTQGGTLISLTTETIATLGTYQAPTSNVHIRIRELNNTDPTKGIYEVHFHNDQMVNTGKRLWLYLSASGAAFQPMEIDLIPYMDASPSSADRLRDFADECYDPTANEVAASGAGGGATPEDIADEVQTRTIAAVTTVANVSGDVAGSILGNVDGNVGGDVTGKVLGAGAGVFIGVGARARSHADNNLAVESVQNNINDVIVGKLDDMLEADGIVYRWTANALELGPSGGGGTGPTAVEIANEVQTRTMAGVSAVGDKTGYALSAAGISSIWAVLTSALSTAGSIGKYIVDRLDVVLSTRASGADYTPARAAKLDNLDATVSSRAPGATALSTVQWTNSRATTLDNLDVTVGSRAPADTALLNSDYTPSRAANLDNLNATVSSRAPAATALSIVQWTNGRAALLDNLDAAISTRAPASTALSTVEWTSPRAVALDNLDVNVGSRLPTNGYTAPNNAGIATIGGVTNKLDTAMVLDGAEWQFTANALELGVGGGGGGGEADWTEPEREQIRHRLGIDGTASEPVITVPSLALESTSEAILAAVGGLGSNIGAGSIEYIDHLYANNNDDEPIVGAEVWASTDSEGTVVIAGAVTTDDFGRFRFMLDPGTYYVWVDHPEYNFNNPFTIQVA